MPILSAQPAEQFVAPLNECLDSLVTGERLVFAKLNDHHRGLDGGQLCLEVAQPLDAAKTAAAPPVDLGAQREHRIALPRHVAEFRQVIFELRREQRLEMAAALRAHHVRATEEHHDIVLCQFQRGLRGKRHGPGQPH